MSHLCDSDRWDRITDDVYNLDLADLVTQCIDRKLLTDDDKIAMQLRNALAEDLFRDVDEPPVWFEDMGRDR